MTVSVRVAVILAAGVGSRLRPLTDDRPKALVPVRGRSILARAVQALASRGVTRLVVASGYREEALVRALSEAPMEVVFRRNPDYETTQNSVSLALCRDAVGAESFYRLDGDVVFDSRILERLDASGADLAAAVDPTRRLDAEAMKVRLRQGSRDIEAFGKGIPLAAAQGESIGIERVSGRVAGALFDALDAAGRAGDRGLYYEDVYSRLIQRGALVAEAIDVTGLDWCEVDTPADLAAAESLFPEP